MSASQKRKKNFVWYKNGKEEGIKEVIDTLIRNTHYDLDRVIKREVDGCYCNNFSLLSEEEVLAFKKEILLQLEPAIKKEKQEIKAEILQTLEKIHHSISCEIESAKERIDYIPEFDYYDMRDAKGLEDTQYQITKLNDLYDRLEREINAES